MKLIVGLGNPGIKYQNTRHNIGFLALDTLLEAFEPQDKTFWEEMDDPSSILKKQKKNFASIKILNNNSHLSSLNSQLILAKPETFMNNSGHAVSRLLSFYKINPEDMIVIYDDMDLPFGKIRIRFGGGAGGHHGVESIIEHIGDKFLRIRLGIGNPRKVGEKFVSRDTTDYVLSAFQSSDRGKVKTMLKQVVKDIDLILKHGIDKYMSKYNS